MKLFDLFVKNLFDFALSLLGLIFFFPVILLAWIVSSIETKSNGMFLQQRVGKNGKLFTANHAGLGMVAVIAFQTCCRLRFKNAGG